MSRADDDAILAADKLLKKAWLFRLRCFCSGQPLEIGGLQIDHTLVNELGDGAEKWLKKYGGITDEMLLDMAKGMP